MKGSFFAVLALGAVVWAFALIGVLSVARGMTPVDWLPSLPSSETSVPDLTAAVIPGLDEYPGARCSEFRAEVFGNERVTEIEYVVESNLPEVRDHYRAALARGGWTVEREGWVYGEWVYTVSSGARHGAIEIEHRNGVTEIEVELAEPLESLDTASDF